MGKYLGHINNRMEREEFPMDIRHQVIEIYYLLKDNQDLSGLFKKLGDSNNFFDSLLELYIAYGLKDYRPKYEVKYINGKRPDFTLDINSQKVLIEVKSKHKADSENKLDEVFEEIKPKIIFALDRRPEDKFLCRIHFESIPKEYDLVELVKSIPQKIANCLINSIREGDVLPLDEGRDYKITLKFISSAPAWDIVMESGAFPKDRYTFELLRDILTGEDGLMSKFQGREFRDITIGIVDVSLRAPVFGKMEMSFDPWIGKAILENIMDINPHLKNNLNKVQDNWFYEVRDNIDAIFLNWRAWGNSKDIKFEKFISSEAGEDKIPVINQIYQELTSAFQR